MKTIGFALFAFVAMTTLLALAVGVPPDQFAGPGWLRNLVGGRLALIVGGMVAFIAMDAILQLLWYFL
jgi:hypothetical protein